MQCILFLEKVVRDILSEVHGVKSLLLEILNNGNKLISLGWQTTLMTRGNIKHSVNLKTLLI